MRRLGCLLLILAGAAQAPAQYAPPARAVAPRLPPLLYVKLIGPPGMQVTFLREDVGRRTFDVPCTIALRPGYSARLTITGVPDFPNVAFYPTLDVRGSLALANPLRNADFPAALVFRREDFARVQADVLVKKVVVLERPDTAVPVATTPDAPLEIASAPGRDPLWEAQERGQPLLVLNMGERQLTPGELVNAQGTILFPGEKTLAIPRVAPWLAWKCFPVLDPSAGPGNPGDLLCVPDGGDVGLPAGFNRQGKLRGLDPSDTVAEYLDSHGRQKLAVSNRICLCIPRYVILKTETVLAHEIALTNAEGMRSLRVSADMQTIQPTLEHTQRQLVENLGSRIKPSGTQQTAITAVTGRIDNLVVVGTVHGIKEVDLACAPAAPEPADGPLLINKWPDRAGALVGALVNFTLKYTNTGGQPISNIIVSDSLTNRFEYVPGSAKTDREALFTFQPNDAGSLVLRWEITGTLEPHASGVVTFQVRVR